MKKRLFVRSGNSQPQTTPVTTLKTVKQEEKPLHLRQLKTVLIRREEKFSRHLKVNRYDEKENSQSV
jgi:hypothetical protein